MRKYLALILLVISFTQLGFVVTRVTPIDAHGAGTNYTSASIDTSAVTLGSIQCTWASLTGTPNGTFNVEVLTGGSSWVAKSDPSGNPVLITISGANGSESVSLNGGVVTEPAYRVRYAKVDTTGGTVSCYAAFKG